jgi:hypothetical protein
MDTFVQKLAILVSQCVGLYEYTIQQFCSKESLGFSLFCGTQMSHL